ncbi:SOS response-associated peptidase [Actinokineospora cianjurensis]|uniref:Abasic site processing protein n=1 Tax=Actinokineospora cianjurensis TaxID=585224 RepID=A0A421B9J1_9PSEU|nr:SOS response-associated peptidase [Actinokineospora cianjurensis]RLK61091.1 putative SOS response-associated peptidase YedK [Actinokineospora cianjurensis]
MCGRYASAKDPATLAAEFDAVDAMGDGAPDLDYNVAPTKNVVAVVQRHPRDADGTADESRTERTLRVMKWGLVPTWAKDATGGAKMINARSESAAEKPAFKKSLARRRCILPADGWFEWRRDKTAKQPFYTTTRDGSSLAMAGLWTTWHDKADPSAPVLVTCAVLTTDAVGPIADIHDRMPLLLRRDAWGSWLDPDSDAVADLLAPPARDLVDALEIRPVSQAVNSVRNNGPELLAPFEAGAVDLDAPDLFSPRT